MIIVSDRTDVPDRVLGLEVGADDYILKPFDPRELLARIGVQLRRQLQRADPNRSGRSPLTCRFGPFELDTARHQLLKAGQQLVLTRAEFAVLEALARHPNQPLRRETICKLTRHRRFVASTRGVDIQIARLRRILETEVSQPCYIRTVWGVGYAFFTDPDESYAAFREPLSIPTAAGGA